MSTADVVVVAEASSFQLEDSSAFAPDAAVLLNLAPDHLDRHGTLEAYRDGEAADLRQPGAEPGRGGRRPGIEVPGQGRRVEFGEHDLEGVERIRLRGPHNRENAMAAAAVGAARGLDREAIARGAGAASPACRTGSRRWRCATA